MTMEDSIISATLIYFRIVTCAFQLSKQLSLCSDFKFYSGYQTFFFFSRSAWCFGSTHLRPMDEATIRVAEAWSFGPTHLRLMAEATIRVAETGNRALRLPGTWGLVVPRPISANLGLNFNLGFFFVCVQVFLQKVFRSSNPVNFSVALRSRSFCGTKDSSFDVSGKIHCSHF